MTAATPHAQYIFLDLETTGLDDTRDQITEIAWLYRDESGGIVRREYRVQHNRPPSRWSAARTSAYAGAEKQSLADHRNRPRVTDALTELVRDVVGLGDVSDPVFMVGANPAFDDRFIRRQMDPPYHHHLIDIEAVVFGAFGLDRMPHIADLRGILGIPGDRQGAHSALADAEEVMRAWDALQVRIQHRTAA